MAVRIKFLSVVVPIDRINSSSLPDGFRGLVAKNGAFLDKSFWYDDSLFTEFAMNPYDVQTIVQRWELFGLVSRVEESGMRSWKDLCVVDFYQGPTLACDWLDFDAQQHIAWKKGTEPGKISGPEPEGEVLFLKQEEMTKLQKYIVNERIPDPVKPWWKFW